MMMSATMSRSVLQAASTYVRNACIGVGGTPVGSAGQVPGLPNRSKLVKPPAA